MFSGDCLVGAVCEAALVAFCGGESEGSGEGVDARSMGAALDVGVAAGGVGVAAGAAGREFEGAHEEGGHLAACDRFVGAEAQGFGLAAEGDAEFGEALHVGRPPLACVDVGEAAGGDGLGRFAVEGAHEQHGDLPAQQRLVVAVIPGRVAVDALEQVCGATGGCGGAGLGADRGGRLECCQQCEHRQCSQQQPTLRRARPPRWFR